MVNYYKIADLIVKLDCNGRTYNNAQKYLISDHNGQEDIMLCLPKKRIESFIEHYKNCPWDQAEYIVSGVSFYRKLLDFKGLFLHACAIEYKGKAYLFSGVSGTGKSTHAGIWKKVFGESVKLINEDKPALRYIDGTFWVYGTPWSGSGDSRNVKVPLGGICFLQQAKENRIYPLDILSAMKEITMQTTHFNLTVDQWRKMSDTLDILLSKHQIFKMECNMEDEAATMCYAALSGEKGKLI